MLQNAYLLAKIGADTAENERNFAKNFGGRRGSSRRIGGAFAAAADEPHNEGHNKGADRAVVTAASREAHRLAMLADEWSETDEADARRRVDAARTAGRDELRRRSEERDDAHADDADAAAAAIASSASRGARRSRDDGRDEATRVEGSSHHSLDATLQQPAVRAEAGRHRDNVVGQRRVVRRHVAQEGGVVVLTLVIRGHARCARRVGVLRAARLKRTLVVDEDPAVCGREKDELRERRKCGVVRGDDDVAGRGVWNIPKPEERRRTLRRGK